MIVLLAHGPGPPGSILVRLQCRRPFVKLDRSSSLTGLGSTGSSIRLSNPIYGENRFNVLKHSPHSIKVFDSAPEFGDEFINIVYYSIWRSTVDAAHVQVEVLKQFRTLSRLRIFPKWSGSGVVVSTGTP